LLRTCYCLAGLAAHGNAIEAAVFNVIREQKVNEAAAIAFAGARSFCWRARVRCLRRGIGRRRPVRDPPAVSVHLCLCRAVCCVHQHVTGDLGGRASTSEFAKAVCAKLQ
jgi:hypothetical protein